MSKLCLFLLGSFLLIFQYRLSFSQTLTITVDARQSDRPDTLFITDDDRQLGIRRQIFEMAANPNTVSQKSFLLSDTLPVLLTFNTYRFLVAKNDSVAIAFDKAAGVYKIRGGRYPFNYSIFGEVNQITKPLIRFNIDSDNLEEGMSQLDSFTYKRMDLLEECNTRGISEDVYDYMKAYITYSHVASFPFNTSLSFKKRYPETSSVFLPFLSPDLFKKDRYASMMTYSISASRFVNFAANLRDTLTVSNNNDKNTNGIYYTLRNLEGETKWRVLYFLIINGNYNNAMIPQKDFRQLYPIIESLHLPELYMKDISMQYKKNQLSGSSIPADLLNTTLLQTESGDTTSLARVVELAKGRKILIDFWASWCGPCVAKLPLVKRIAAQSRDISVIYLSMDSNASQWREALKKQQLTGKQYLLYNNFQNTFSRYMLLKSIPRYVLIDENGIISNCELLDGDLNRLESSL